MIGKGVKEVRDHFTEYLRQVRKGENIVATENDRPVALLTPFQRLEAVDERLYLAATKGLVHLPEEGGVTRHKKLTLAGKSLTELIIEEGGGTGVNRFRIFPSFITLLLVLSGCASTTGPHFVKTYDASIERNEIAIVRLDQKRSLRILSCDGIAVPASARYLMVRPGRHELLFSVSGQTLVEVYKMTNKKFLDASSGCTYMLKSETGFFAVGDKWFPTVVDVTGDPGLHIKELPSDEVLKND